MSSSVVHMIHSAPKLLIYFLLTNFSSHSFCFTTSELQSNMSFLNSRERSVEEIQADTLITKTSSQKEQASQPTVTQSPPLSSSSSSSSSVRGGDDKNVGSKSDNGKKKNKQNKSVKTDTLTSEQHTETQTQTQNSSALNEYDTNTSMNSSTLLNADTSAVVESSVTSCPTESPVHNTDIPISDTVIEWRREEEVLLWSKSTPLLESNTNFNPNSHSIAQRRLKGPQRTDFSIGTYSAVRAP